MTDEDFKLVADASSEQQTRPLFVQFEIPKDTTTEPPKFIPLRQWKQINKGRDDS